MNATIRALFIKPLRHKPAVALHNVDAVNGGFHGDCHARNGGRRQILLLSGDVLDELQIEPGAVSENVVVDGLDVMALQEGQQLQLGQATVCVTLPCEPCVQMDRLRGGLRRALENRRGMFVKVLTPGTVRVGDTIQVLRRH